ncbi:hypothetical protein RDI58_018803 [Solanum bulbocastanum]|uniref:Uncharacterized protein n=1 Tax=Solanum bulbocastanum TaxID=147425 RepID=A0AAN8TIR5_SOLBU
MDLSVIILFVLHILHRGAE